MLSNFFAKVSILKESSYGFSKNTEFIVIPLNKLLTYLFLFAKIST